MKNAECDLKCGLEPAVPAPEDPVTLARRREATRAKVARHRTRVLREVWGQVGARRYKAEACPWQRCDECRCDSARPCEYEKRLVRAAQAEAERRFGVLLAGLVVSALLDVARAVAAGKEADVTTARLKLAELLSRDQNAKMTLELQRRRLRMEEASKRPKGPSLAEYLAARPATAPPPPSARATADTAPGASGEGVEPAAATAPPTVDPASRPPAHGISEASCCGRPLLDEVQP